VDGAWFDYTRACRRRSLFLNEVTPSGRIRPDGTFSLRDRFTLRDRATRRAERFVVLVDGQFAGGVVTGTLRVTTVERRAGRIIDRCDTGPLTFAASL
jgi:hypothetical protein